MRRVLDAQKILDDLVALHRWARREEPRYPIEVYQRVSVRFRVSLEDGCEATIAGREDGLAVRLLRGSGKVAFGAASGVHTRALARALGLVERSETERCLGVADWWEGEDAVLQDLEPLLDLPSPTHLSNWLRSAVPPIRAAKGDRAPIVLGGPAWIEAGVTVEALVTEGRLRTTRARKRVWAGCLLRLRDGSGRIERPSILAARALEDLPAGGWRDRSPEESASPPRTVPPRGRGPLVVFHRESAGSLVGALAQVLHNQGSEDPIPVGPAWRVLDDPTDPRALHGGSFDDVGFRTRAVRLADGVHGFRLQERSGHLRRPSFRDPPAPMAASLIVEERGDPMPEKGILVTGLRRHPIDGDNWLLEADGEWLKGGAGTGARSKVFLRANPREMVRGCVGSVGPAQPGPLGVVTPSLVFENLTFV